MSPDSFVTYLPDRFRYSAVAGVMSRRWAVPRLALADHAAVVTAAGLVVHVVPVMWCVDRSAILSFVRDTQLDQEPGQSSAKPSAPRVRMRSFRLHLVPAHPSRQNDLREVRLTSSAQRGLAFGQSRTVLAGTE